jgi:hypothetical protein
MNASARRAHDPTPGYAMLGHLTSENAYPDVLGVKCVRCWKIELRQ